MKGKFKVVLRLRFSASHILRKHSGKCRNLHGHTYEVEVGVESSELNQEDMVIDFEELKKGIGEVLNELDHRHLNEIEEFKKVDPTAENIARFIYLKLKNKISVKMSFVRIYEHRDAYVEYSE